MIFFFVNLLYLLYVINFFNLKQMKRTTRKMSEETKKKISESMKGKNKTDEHKVAISNALKKYWETIPYE